MKQIAFSLLVLTIFTFFACNNEHFLYDKKCDIANAHWSYSDTLNFDFEIKDTFKIYNLYMEVEHPDNYSFQNLYVMTHTKFPSGERPSQRINVDLAANNGEWLGKKSGTNFTHRIDLQQNAYFNVSGKYQLTLAQFMRVDSLPIKSIRFFVEETKQTRDQIDVKKGDRPAAQKKYIIR
jgi:gliding motility-associated lipoprotein GldH